MNDVIRAEGFFFSVESLLWNVVTAKPFLLSIAHFNPEVENLWLSETFENFFGGITISENLILFLPNYSDNFWIKRVWLLDIVILQKLRKNLGKKENKITKNWRFLPFDYFFEAPVESWVSYKTPALV